MKADYNYREVECPLCGKRFVTLVEGSTYELNGHKGSWYKCRCTGCEEWLFIHEDDKNKTIWEGEIDEDDIRLKSFCIS